ncbi:MAG TPA: tetratricopeptide repeat protein [Thermoanaerobaculia bacterium]|nr:tetratricopeptide repeat protein [Thermoanaerobaculia bacterium]
MHVSDERMRAFVSDRLEPTQRREILSHLLGGCSDCQKAARRYWAAPGSADDAAAASEAASHFEPGLDDSAWNRILARATDHQHRLDAERAAATQQWVELERHPQPRRLLIARNQRRYQTWGLGEELLRLSWENRFDDPARMLEQAEIALAVAESLDDAIYGSATWDLRARALAHVGNAQRVSSDFRAAEKTFRAARKALDQGTGDPLELATILNFEATLRVRQRRFDDALKLAEREIALCRRWGQLHRLGEAYHSRGVVHALRGDDGQAIRDFERCLDYLDPERDPRIVLTSRHNLISLLHEEGRLAEALGRLRETRPMYHQLGDRLNLLRLRQLEGEIALAQGETKLAEECLLEARNGMIAADLAWDSAEISLRLAEMYLSQGRNRETREVAEQIMPIFQSRDLHTEAIAALLLFREAVFSETLTAHMVRQTISFLRQLRTRPPA